MLDVIYEREPRRGVSAALADADGAAEYVLAYEASGDPELAARVARLRWEENPGNDRTETFEFVLSLAELLIDFVRWHAENGEAVPRPGRPEPTE
ncbi:MAG: hypothetical protein V4850_16200 [Myxococcota bacterium]